MQVDVLLRGLTRLATQGDTLERRYGTRQARMVRDWQASEEALAEHLQRFAGQAPASVATRAGP